MHGLKEIDDRKDERRTMEYAIVMSDVVQKFAGREVLKGVNLQVHAGEIFGLLGPSGAGKTTIIKILTGQIKQAEGESSILGKNVKSLDPSIYKKIGMMMDNLGLYERLSCYDNLNLFAGIQDIPRDRILQVLEKVGLKENEKCPVAKLSRGMRGRLALARAVLSEPDILFLDEPVSGLDPSTAYWIHHLIREEQKRGATIFLTTHNMEEADQLCDHIALLNEGKIIEYGEPWAICRKYNHQNKLQIRLLNGVNVELPNDSSSTDRVKEYMEQGMIETIHSTEPSLETVFMELTGRKFE